MHSVSRSGSGKKDELEGAEDNLGSLESLGCATQVARLDRFRTAISTQFVDLGHLLSMHLYPAAQGI